MTVAEVRSAVMKLGLLREGIEGQFIKYVELVSSLYARRAWVADGTGSWEAFAQKHNVPVDLPREERQAVSVALSANGMSTRAIAATQGVHQSQIVRDLQTGDAPRITSTTGMDGRNYERPNQAPAKPRRSPLPDAYRSALWAVRKSVERLERIHEDDRFESNRPQLREDGYWRQLDDFEERLHNASWHLHSGKQLDDN